LTPRPDCRHSSGTSCISSCSEISGFSITRTIASKTLNRIMWRQARRHAHGDADTAIDEQVRKLARQDRRLLKRSS
jgi:hypothetical protein